MGSNQLSVANALSLGIGLQVAPGGALLWRVDKSLRERRRLGRQISSASRSHSQLKTIYSKGGRICVPRAVRDRGRAVCTVGGGEEEAHCTPQHSTLKNNSFAVKT